MEQRGEWQGSLWERRVQLAMKGGGSMARLGVGNYATIFIGVGEFTVSQKMHCDDGGMH